MSFPDLGGEVFPYCKIYALWHHENHFVLGVSHGVSWDILVRFLRGPYLTPVMSNEFRLSDFWVIIFQSGLVMSRSEICPTRPPQYFTPGLE